MARQTIRQRETLRRHTRFDRGTEAMAALSDLTLTPREALVKFEGLARRMKPKVAEFYLFIGDTARARKADRRFDTDQLSRWEDDGGRG